MATKDTALKALIEPVVTAMGFELWGIDYLSQGKHSRLVIFIDHSEGVGVDDCADVSRQVSAVLDVEDLLPESIDSRCRLPGWIDRCSPSTSSSAMRGTRCCEAACTVRRTTQVPGIAGRY